MKKRWIQVSSALLALTALFFLCMPTYVRKALIHWYPDITDTYLFPSNAVVKADSCWDFSLSRRFNTYEMTPEENAYLKKFGTVAYLVIQQDSVCMKNTGRDGRLRLCLIFFRQPRVLWDFWSG